MTGTITELRTRNKTEEVENQLNVTGLAPRGLRALPLAYEELNHDNLEGEGNEFGLIGPLTIFDPPRDEVKQAINDALALCVKVKAATGD